MIKDRVLICILVHDIEGDVSAFTNSIKSLKHGDKEVIAVNMTDNITAGYRYEEVGIQSVLAPIITDRNERFVEAFNHIRRLFLSGEAEWLFLISDRLIISDNAIERLLENRKLIVSGAYPISKTLSNIVIPKTSWETISSIVPESVRQLENRELPPHRFRVLGTGLGLCLIHRNLLIKAKFRLPEKLEIKRSDDFLFCSDVRKLNWCVWCDPRVKGEVKEWII